MFQKHKRESSPDSIGEPINEEELAIGVPMKQRGGGTAAGGAAGGKSSRNNQLFDYKESDAMAAGHLHRSPASSASASAVATSAIVASYNGGAESVGKKPNSSASSVVVNLPTSYPNSEMDYGSVSYPPSPSVSSSNNDKPQVRITFL